MPAYPTENVPTPAQFASAGQVGPFDVNTLRELYLEVILTSLTGGTAPTWQPEYDQLDDDTPANPLPLWKLTAASAPTNWLALLGVNQGAAPSIAAWVVASVPSGFGAFGQLKWTVTGAPTAVAAKVFLYAK